MYWSGKRNGKALFVPRRRVGTSTPRPSLRSHHGCWWHGWRRLQRLPFAIRTGWGGWRCWFGSIAGRFTPAGPIPAAIPATVPAAIPAAIPARPIIPAVVHGATPTRTARPAGTRPFAPALATCKWAETRKQLTWPDNFPQVCPAQFSMLGGWSEL